MRPTTRRSPGGVAERQEGQEYQDEPHGNLLGRVAGRSKENRGNRTPPRRSRFELATKGSRDRWRTSPRCPNLCARCSDAGWPGPGRFEGLHRASPTTGDRFVGSSFAGLQLHRRRTLRWTLHGSGSARFFSSTPLFFPRRNSPPFPHLPVARIRGSNTSRKDATQPCRNLRRLASYWTKFRMTGHSRACILPPAGLRSFFFPTAYHRRGHHTYPRKKDLANLASPA